jgi:uncharacterized phage protein (TIGR02218 family)
MSYTSLETSIQSGRPVELYEFKLGLEYYRYTSASVTITKNGVEFYPESIERTDVEQSDDIHKGGLKLDVPRTNILGATLLAYTPDEVVTVTIFRGHYGDDSYISYWKGRVMAVQASGNTITLGCESIFTSMKRPGLRARFERMCRHSLYSYQCGISRDSWRVNGSVEIDNTLSLTINIASTYADGYFVGGIATIGGASRFITSHIGGVIKISRSFNEYVAGQDVALFPGCDKSMATCQSKFDNLDNYGGFPFIPTRNPFNGSSIV